MDSVNITNNFRLKICDLEELKQTKIEYLKQLTNEIILEKYPYYTQLNNSRDTKMVSDISSIRAKYGIIKNKIIKAETELDALDITVDKANLKRNYFS